MPRVFTRSEAAEHMADFAARMEGARQRKAFQTCQAVQSRNAELVAAFDTGMTVDALSKRYQLTMDSVRRILRDADRSPQARRFPALHRAIQKESAITPPGEKLLRSEARRAGDEFLRKLIPSAIRANAVPPVMVRHVAAEARRLRLPVEIVAVGTGAAA